MILLQLQANLLIYPLLGRNPEQYIPKQSLRCLCRCFILFPLKTAAGSQEQAGSGLMVFVTQDGSQKTQETPNIIQASWVIMTAVNSLDTQITHTFLL